MVVLLTCKNEEDSIKNGGLRVLTRFYINCSDTKGQLTTQSVVESGRNSNPFKLLLAHLSRRLIGELIVYQWSGVRPSIVRPSVVHNAQRSSSPKLLGR